MKKLNLFAIGVVAMMMAAAGVKAAGCNLPADGKNAQPGDCQASVGTRDFAVANDAWDVAYRDGGTIKLYTDSGISATGTISKSLVIDLNGHTFTFGNAGQFAVADGAKLTIKNGDVVLGDPTATAFTVAKGGELDLSALKVTGADYDWTLIYNAGTLDVADVNVNVPKAYLVETAKANATTTLSGTYNVFTVLKVNSSSAAADRKNPASTVTVKGDYTTAGEALKVEGGIKVTVNADIEVKDSGNSYYAVARVNEAELVIENGDLITNSNHAIVVEGTTSATKLTVNGGGIVTTKSTYNALQFRNPKAVYKITDGTFDGADDADAAISLIGAFTETKDGETHVVSAVKGILTGGKYLTNIIAKMEDADNATVDLSDELVAEGYAIKVEDPYKVVVPTNTVTPEDPTQTPDDGEANPNTLDNVSSVVAMGGVSLAVAAFGIISLRKREN